MCYLIQFGNSCDIGNIIFSEGFIGVIYFDAHIAESPEDIFQEGSENNEGEFVRSYQRGIKQYILRTGLITSNIVEQLYFLRLCDTVDLTYPTGETVRLNNIDVSHTWQFDDKQEATVELRFDLNEVLVSTACCIL